MLQGPLLKIHVKAELLNLFPFCHGESQAEAGLLILCVSIQDEVGQGKEDMCGIVSAVLLSASFSQSRPHSKNLLFLYISFCKALSAAFDGQDKHSINNHYH